MSIIFLYAFLFSFVSLSNVCTILLHKNLNTRTQWRAYMFNNNNNNNNNNNRTWKLVAEWMVGWLVGFYGISTFVGYFMSNPFLYK